MTQRPSRLSREPVISDQRGWYIECTLPGYRIVYEIFADRLVVLTVFEGHAVFLMKNLGELPAE
ncbi:hypothetical protein DSTSK_35980 [Desulforhabdus sp. TSK]|nr:hypothetical protein DSTSK_35980 [Desulforhabdus sp. TSK]